MQRLPHNTSLVGRFVAIALTTLVLAVSLVVGAAVFLALIGVLAIGLAVFYVRLRWRLRHSGPARAARPERASGQVIEGEYVVERHQRVKQP